LANPYTYTGREYDPESGLYYYRARYYDAGIGRFLSEDPVGFLGGVNFYGYCVNNPVNWIDPWGLCAYRSESWWEELAINPYLSDPQFWEGSLEDARRYGGNLKLLGKQMLIPPLPFVVNQVGRPPTNIFLRTIRKRITYVARPMSSGYKYFWGAYNKAAFVSSGAGTILYLTGAVLSGDYRLPDHYQAGNMLD